MSRPLDTWRVCGRPVRDGQKDRGCTCKPNDPSPWLVDKALDRLAHEKEETGAPRSPRTAPGHHREPR